MGAMRAGHVVDLGRIPAAAGEAEVDGHAAALEEDFDRGGCKPGVETLVHELIRHAIEVVVNALRARDRLLALSTAEQDRQVASSPSRR
jgi:hypothetical protein